MKHHAVHLLSRRYDLTTTGYKYLEIEISAGPPNYVEIAQGNRGHELSLSLETWKRWKDPLRAAMEYLQDATKRIQRQFYKRWSTDR
ncbi:hypothetical protein ALC53_05067 [Atta colombica]|uniref:Uncharacterized protein n=1 Tax=Atta colombica TaxID=520822 RepID=A0A151I493_9HYME|nr:hypothetical protein ALC53_05067 [Atta colombica]